MAYQEINLFVMQIPQDFDVEVLCISSKEIGVKLHKPSTVVVPERVQKYMDEKKCYLGWNFRRDAFVFAPKANIDQIRSEFEDLEYSIEQFDLGSHVEPFSMVINKIFEESLARKYIVFPRRYRAFDRKMKVSLPSTIDWLVSLYRGLRFGAYPLKTFDGVGERVGCGLAIDQWIRIEPNVSLEDVFDVLKDKVDVKDWFLNWYVILWCPIRCEKYYSGTCPLRLRAFGNLRQVLKILGPDDKGYELSIAQIRRKLAECDILSERVNASTQPYIVTTRKDGIIEDLPSNLLSIEPRSEVVDNINKMRLGKLPQKHERLTRIQMQESFLLNERGLDKAGSHKRRNAIYAILDDLLYKDIFPLELFDFSIGVAREMINATVIQR